MEKKFFDNLENKTVIVAGGNGLIGSAIVKALEAYGADVVCADIRGEGEYFDMAEPESVGALLQRHYKCDAFINCTRTDNTKASIDSWLRCTEAVAQFFSCGGGSIVNFGSIYGVVGSDMSLYEDTSMTMPIGYAGIKGFIISASRDIACKYGRYDVRCNVVSPGGVYDNQPIEFERRYVKKVPLGRMAESEDIVGIVLFLVSDWSEYITGQNFLVDGGLTAQC